MVYLDDYWSVSEHSYDAWFQNFSSGSQMFGGKLLTYNVRAVRSK